MVDLPSLLVTEPSSSSGTAERDPMSINRLSELAVKDRESILLLLDSGSLCHVGFVADDGLLERYLEGEVPSFDELEHCLARGVASASVFPVVCGSALAEIAIDRLADFLCEIGPSPADRPTPIAAGDVTVEVAGGTASVDGAARDVDLTVSGGSASARIQDAEVRQQSREDGAVDGIAGGVALGGRGVVLGAALRTSSVIASSRSNASWLVA